jgi:YebC/PmpR family DNA-binding regulatory protein
LSRQRVLCFKKRGRFVIIILLYLVFITNLSGHSKWSTIKHQKAVADQRRGKLFSKISKAISVAAKEGRSADPEANPRLRLAMEQARAVNMPKENIKRAIERGIGKGKGSGLETITYEGFGPEKVAVVIECVTDNKNRTGAEIKSFFERKGGHLGAPGSANYLFKKKGLILVKKAAEAEKQMLQLIDLGIEDVEEEKELIEIYTRPEELEAVKKKIAELGFDIQEASLTLKPTTPLSLEDEEKKNKVLSFLKQLDDFDDVQKIYCNADFIEPL